MLTEEDLDDKPETINKLDPFTYFNDAEVDVVLQENGDGLMNSYINLGETNSSGGYTGQNFGLGGGPGGFFNNSISGGNIFGA
jgi:hypothetical protein